MAGKYEIFADEQGGFRFRLKASNGDVAVTSESYKTMTSVRQGIERVRRNAVTEKVEDLTQDR
ncbi:YegP family protein [Arthrobacter sp. NPDC093125]|uniref:YegP family protein n=1 Tax=Arthrobacter sp. NPDC093125 TaxID=3363944 RepID=UPI003808C0B1